MFFASLAFVASIVGCVNGRCNNFNGGNNYPPSIFSRIGVRAAEPYNGSPVYFVNQGSYALDYGYANTYANRGRLLTVDSLADNGMGLRNMGRSPLRRSFLARRTRMNAMNGMDAMSAPEYTVTRSPRDFLAPNPPSIGE